MAKPNDVVTANGLTHQQKLHILKQWELDTRELDVATAKNMRGGEAPRLDEALNPITQLGAGARLQSWNGL